MRARRPLTPLDLPWALLDNDRHPMHVAGVIVCKAPENAGADFVDRLVAAMRETTHATDPFDRRLRRQGLGRIWPQWETAPSIDLDQHLYRTHVPGPGGADELGRLVSVLHRSRLDLSRPPWELHVLDGLAGGHFALYAKFHHSLADGVGAIRILRSLLSTVPSSGGTSPIWTYRPRHAHRAPAVRRRSAAAGLPRAALAAVAHALGRSPGRPYSAPASVLNTEIDADREVVMTSFALSRFRRLADAMSGSINDAYLAMCSTALRSFLLASGSLPSASLTAIVPVSVRPVDGADTGNAMTFAFLPLATDVGDVRVRSDRITTATAAAKTRLARLPKHVVNAYSVLTMTPFVAGQLLGLGARTRPMFNVALSNVTGPPETSYYDRAEVVDIFPVSILQSGQALNLTALSYAGRLGVTATACPTLLPGIDRIAEHLTAALLELERTFGVEG